MGRIEIVFTEREVRWLSQVTQKMMLGASLAGYARMPEARMLAVRVEGAYAQVAAKRAMRKRTTA
jgi:hypothetical protein